VPENISAWWERRQRSKGVAVPYPVGTYRAAWAAYPMLVRQYHPDLNREITLTQIPPAADVYLTWQCDTGHLFVATPEEQRSRPGRVRRRSAWCPVCADLAAPRRIRPAPLWPAPLEPAPAPATTGPVSAAPLPAPAPSAPEPEPAAARAAPQLPAAPPAPTRVPLTSSALAGRPAAPSAASATSRRPGTAVLGRRRGRTAHADPPRDDHGGREEGGATRAPGTAFWSARAPATASAAEALLRQKLGARLEFDARPNAVAVARPFHGRLEVWPDIVIDELRVALEYDTVGRFGLEHVGPREQSDRSKDRLLRAAGWEVVRIRCAPLSLLGPHDLTASSTVTDRLVAQLLDTLRAIRGDLIVNSYLCP
jgi:hypothetical protein